MISFNYDSDNFIMCSMLALLYRNKAIYDVYMMFIGVFMPSFSNIQLHILPYLPSPDYVFAVFSHLIWQFTIGYV